MAPGDRLRSPAPSSCSSPNSRIVSSMAKRGSPSAARSWRTSVWSTSEVEARRGRRGRAPPGRAHRLGRLQRAAAGEDRQPGEQPLLVGRRAGRSSRRWRRAASAGGPGRSRAPPVSSASRCSSRARSAGGDSTSRPGGRQLDGQRQPVQPAADLGDRRRRSRRSARSRAAPPRPARRTAGPPRTGRRPPRSAGRPRLGQRQRRHRQLVLAREAQRARLVTSDLQPGAAREQVLDHRRRRPATCSKLSSTSSSAPVAQVVAQRRRARAGRGSSHAQRLGDRRGRPGRGR